MKLQRDTGSAQYHACTVISGGRVSLRGPLKTLYKTCMTATSSSMKLRRSPCTRWLTSTRHLTVRKSSSSSQIIRSGKKRHGAYNSKTLDCMLEMSPFLNFPLLQAALFTIENIHSMISAYEFPKPKLVITFMPCSGSSHTINHGMIDAVRLENRLPLSRLLVF